MTVGILSSADDLLQLMKQEIDRLVARDEKLQQFLSWVNQKSRSVDVSYQPVPVRAFFLSLSLDLSQSLDVSRVLDLSQSLDLSLDLSRYGILEPELKHSLQQLKDQLPNPKEDKQQFKQWWEVNSQAWIEQLRTVMIEYRNIGHDWQFNEQQEELLRQYYDANKLLVDCLNSNCYVSQEVRQEIEDTLLLPMAEIEKRH